MRKEWLKEVIPLGVLAVAVVLVVILSAALLRYHQAPETDVPGSRKESARLPSSMLETSVPASEIVSVFGNRWWTGSYGASTSPEDLASLPGSSYFGNWTAYVTKRALVAPGSPVLAASLSVASLPGGSSYGGQIIYQAAIAVSEEALALPMMMPAATSSMGFAAIAMYNLEGGQLANHLWASITDSTAIAEIFISPIRGDKRVNDSSQIVILRIGQPGGYAAGRGDRVTLLHPGPEEKGHSISCTLNPAEKPYSAGHALDQLVFTLLVASTSGKKWTIDIDMGLAAVKAYRVGAGGKAQGYLHMRHYYNASVLPGPSDGAESTIQLSSLHHVKAA